jgi:hypothetical protein
MGKQAAETVEADVYLLTDERPAMLPDAGAFAASDGLVLDHSAAASELLLADLRSDAGMEWVPDEAWLTKIAVDVSAGDLDFDLAIDTTGANTPSPVDAGYAPFRPNPAPRSPVAAYLLVVAALVVLVPVLGARIGDRWMRPGPPAGA